MKKYAPAVLRIGMSAIILWFGYQQIAHTLEWTGYLPDWVNNLPVPATSIVYLNGLFEIASGFLLLFGLYTRIVALLLALHLFDITYVVGYTAVGMRDLGLSIATLSVFLYGGDVLSLDRFFKNYYYRD